MKAARILALMALVNNLAIEQVSAASHHHHEMSYYSVHPEHLSHNRAQKNWNSQENQLQTEATEE